jgi:hypothetical protein
MLEVGVNKEFDHDVSSCVIVILVVRSNWDNRLQCVDVCFSVCIIRTTLLFSFFLLMASKILCFSSCSFFAS